MRLIANEHIGNVLIAVALTVVIGLLAVSLLYFSISAVSNVVPRCAATKAER